MLARPFSTTGRLTTALLIYLLAGSLPGQSGASASLPASALSSPRPGTSSLAQPVTPISGQAAALSSPQPGIAALPQSGAPAAPAQETPPVRPDLRQVTTHPDIDLSPRLSPDGQHLAYVSRQTYNFDIWVRSNRTGRTRQITFNKADDFYPVWYPDSRALVFVSQKNDAAGDIWRIRFREIEGDLIPRGDPELISHYQGFDGYPTVSPDGKKIAWVSDATGRHEIWFHNDNTGKTRQLTYRGGTHPAWSSRLDFIAFTSFRAGPASGGDIWLINLHGPKPSGADTATWDNAEPPAWPLTIGPAADGFPTWTPDGRQLIFLRFGRDSNGDSLLTPADRGLLWSLEPFAAPTEPVLQNSLLAPRLVASFNPRMVQSAMPITSDGENIMQPWCGGDERVYFTSDRGGNLDIWSIPAAGPVPRLATAAAQFQWADAAFPLPEAATRWYLGPLCIGYQEAATAADEQRLLGERILAMERVLTFFPDSSREAARALYETGVAHMLRREEEEARTMLQLLLDRFPGERRTAAWTELALLGLEFHGQAEGRSQLRPLKERADEILRRYSDQPEPSAAGRLAIGDLYFAEGDHQRAFAEYNRVQKEYPGERGACAASQLKIGDLYSKFASREEVVQAWLSVVERYPEQRQWMLPARDRILNLLTSGRRGSDSFIARYREIVGQYRSFPALAAEAQFRIGNILLRDKEYRDAIAEFEAVETLFPDLPDEVFAAQMGRAEALLRLGDSGSALSLLEKLSREQQSTRPDLATLAADRLVASLLDSADKLRASGDLQLAALRYRSAWEHDLRNLHAHRGYLECMYYQRLIDQAIIEYRQLNILHPKDNILTYALGLSYSYKGTEGAELDNNPDGLLPNYLVSRSGSVIARALSYDYTLVPGYLTVAFNYEMMEDYEARQRAKPVPALRRAWNALRAPFVDLYHRLTFYQERKPARYYERAIHELNKALVLNDESREALLEANLALNLANNYYSLGEFGYEKAYEYYQLKLKYDSSFVDKPREALIYERMAHCALVTEDLERGPAFARRAIALYTAMDKEPRVLLNTKRLALLYEVGGRHEEAIEHYQIAAEMERRRGALADLMRSYRSIAYNYLRLGEPADAILFARRALELLESGKIKKIKGEASRMEIGFLGWYFPVPFIDFSTMGANSLKNFTTEDERALLYSIFAETYTRQKEYGSAISFYQKKIDIFHKRKDYRAEATFYNNLGYIYYLRGDHSSAWDNYRRSQQLCEKYRIPEGVVQNSLNLGRLASGLALRQRLGYADALSAAEIQQRADSAAAYLGQAINFIEETQLYANREKAQLLLQLAEVILIDPQAGEAVDGGAGLRDERAGAGAAAAAAVPAALKRLERAAAARSHLEAALDISRRYRLERLELAALYALGEVYNTSGATAEAWKGLNRSRRMAMRQGEYELAWRIDVALGDLLANMEAAQKRQLVIQKTPLEFYLEAVDLLEAHPGGAPGGLAPDLRRVRQQPYNRVIATLVQMGDPRGALLFAERLRAKVFLDLTSGEEIVLRKERHKLYLGNARFIQKKIDDLSGQLLRARSQSDVPARQLREWRQERENLEAEYEELLTKVRAEVPELESLVRVQPVDLLQLQKELQPREAVILFHSLPDRLLAWTVGPHSLTMEELPLTRPELLAFRRSWNHQAGPPAEEDQRVWPLLLAPVDKLPAEVQRLTIVPDDILLLSWSAAAARINGQERAVTVSSSLSHYFYAAQKRRLGGQKIYIAGDPALAAALLQVPYQVSLPVQGQAENSFAAQVNDLGLAELIHLTTRNSWNSVDPLESQISFRVDRSAAARFTIRELFTQNLAAGLVTFTSPEALLALEDAEAFTALEHALLYAGAPSFIAPLWPGSADRELEFYTLFYANLQTHPPAAALAATQKSLADRGVPFTEWARFQLFGFGGMTAAEEEQYAVEGFAGKVRRGHGAFSLGEWKEAITYYEEAFQMAQRQGDSTSVARLRGRILESAVNGQFWGKAIEIQERELNAAEQGGSADAIAGALNLLAYFYTQNGQYEEGVSAKRRYAELAQRYGLREQAAQSTRETGLIFERGGQYQKALDFFDAAWSLYRQIGDTVGMGQSLRDKGRIEFLYRDNYAAALRIQEEALALLRTGPAKADLIDALQNLGNTHEKIGNYLDALAAQQEALALAEKLGEQRLIALSRQYLANLHWKMGDYQSALQHQNFALEVFTRLDDEKLLQVALATRGLIALSLGQPQQALEYEQKALELAERRHDRVDQATIRKNLGMIYRADGRFELARASLEAAAAIDSSLGSRRGLAYDYRNLGAVYGIIGRGQEGMMLARRGLALSREIGDRRNEVQSLLVLGTLQRRHGQPDSARRNLEAAATMAGELFMPDIAWRAQRQLADLFGAAGERPAQLQAFHAALEIIEGMRSRIRVEEYAAGFIDDKLEVYSALIAVLAENGQAGAALEVAERARGRSFLDLLGGRRLSLASPGDVRLAAIGDSLHAQLNRRQAESLYLQAQNDPLSAQRQRELGRQIDDLRGALSEHLRQTRAANPELFSLMGVEPLIEAEIRKVAPPSGAVLTYYLHRDRLYLWLVTREAVQLRQVEVSAAALAEEVTRLRTTLTRQLTFAEPARRLYQQLIEPFAAEIAGREHLVIVPHQVLHYLPFTVLQDEKGRYLGFEHTLSTAPSLSVLGHCLAKGEAFAGMERRQMEVMAFGNPDLGNRRYDLPFAEREVRSLRRYYPSVAVSTGAEASESRLRQASPWPPLLLFSCHGEFDEHNPMLSALLLAPDQQHDGRLEAHELFGLEMNSYLVAMSACETGLGTLLSGDEVVGLTRAFTYAGAASLMASMWKVDDLATAVLVKRFFHHLAEGDSRPQALRKAQRVVAETINAYPSYWAAFQISGDYR